MKKIIIGAAILFTSTAAFAQEDKAPLVDRSLLFDILNICAIVTVIYLISNWILQMMKHNLDYRLKSKILEKDTAENIVVQLVRPPKKDNENGKAFLQWTFILAGIGAGFTLINFSRPYGVHSLAIMAFSIAAGFAGNYYASRRLEK
ncbi:hypothetical protein ACX0G9_25325 [Flavitalea flava]